jgi:hypothetical protein
MEDKKKPYVIRLLKLISIIPSIFGIFSYCLQIFEDELHFVKKNLFSFAIICIVNVFLAIIIWLCILGLILFYLLALKLNIFISLFIIILINLLLLLINCLLLSKIKHHVAFTKTRNLLHGLRKFKT